MKRITLLLVLAFTAILSMTLPLTTEALTQQSAPYPTFTIGPNGRYVQTQTAYEPAGTFVTDITLNQPEDMVRLGDDLYVADTGNRRVVKFNMLTGESTILLTNLGQPTGVHITEEGDLYVVDKTRAVIEKYDATMQLVKTYGRPTEPIFGTSSPFVPTKVTVGPRGILYVVGEGSTAGIMQINQVGEFIGFFGTNTTSFSWLQALTNFFGITRATNLPTSPSNVALDAKGSVFTVSPTDGNAVKKFNIASQAILSMSPRHRPVSIYINDFDNIFTISNEGIITEYDSYGNMIFEFGGLDTGNRISGLYVNPVDVISDGDANLWVLDKGTGTIQLLQRSGFASLVHQGLINFKAGIYSLTQWERVLKMNSMFALANGALARGHYRLQAYEEALRYYAIAFDRGGYSEAFWQLRYQWLELNLGWVLLAGIILWLLRLGWRWAQSRVLSTQLGQRVMTMPAMKRWQQDYRLTRHVLAHPLDTYQDIKHLKQSSWLMAGAIYLLVLVASIFEIYITGFIFQSVNLNTFNVLIYSLTFLGSIGLFIFSNYLVATITNGEGFFKDVYLATAHALIPYLWVTPILAIVSNGLSYNEVIVYQLLDGLRYVWPAILIVLMIKEVHNYDVKGLIKNIFLTLFTMMMLVLIGFLLYVLAAQVVNYIESIIQEVLLRG
ncbi:MAG: YIP1 family protein [Bacilli bacterium]